jgi:cell division protein FtsB
MKWYSYILVFLFFVFQGQLWFSSGGVIDLEKTHQKLAKLKSSQAKLKLQNNEIATDIKDLRSGRSSVEERARESLGMVRGDEVFFQVLPVQ